MKHTILVVDDERDILDLLKYNLEKEGFRVLTASDGKRALTQAETRPDLIVLDIMMPEMDGFEVSRVLRQQPTTAGIPIIFLTARGSEVDEVVGLELGADDYLIKPVRVRTFLARVKKILRSSDHSHDPGTRLKIGDLEIFPENYTVKVGGGEINFPKKEFEVLLFLARHPDRVIKRETLLNELWGEKVYVVDRTVDVHIRKIREKLGKLAWHIETVKGVGYRFKKEEE